MLSTSPPLSPSPLKERGRVVVEGASPLQASLDRYRPFYIDGEGRLI